MAVVLLFSGWLFVAHGGTLSLGHSFYAGNGVSRVGDGVSDTRYMARAEAGTTFTLSTSVRNSGSVKMTVLGLSPTRSALTSWIVRARFAPFEPAEDGSDTLAPPPADTDETVTLEPGAEAAMVLDFRVPTCMYLVPGAFIETNSIRVRTRVLGVVRTQLMPLADLPLAVRGDSPQLSGFPVPLPMTSANHLVDCAAEAEERRERARL